MSFEAVPENSQHWSWGSVGRQTVPEVASCNGKRNNSHYCQRFLSLCYALPVVFSDLSDCRFTIKLHVTCSYFSVYCVRLRSTLFFFVPTCMCHKADCSSHWSRVLTLVSFAVYVISTHWHHFGQKLGVPLSYLHAPFSSLLLHLENLGVWRSTVGSLNGVRWRPSQNWI